MTWKGKTTTNTLPFNGQNKWIVNGFKRTVNSCKRFGYPFKRIAENVKRLGKVQKRIEGNVKQLKKNKQKAENVKRILIILSLNIICSSRLTLFLELRSQETVRFSEQIMSATNIPAYARAKCKLLFIQCQSEENTWMDSTRP